MSFQPHSFDARVESPRPRHAFDHGIVLKLSFPSPGGVIVPFQSVPNQASQRFSQFLSTIDSNSNPRFKRKS
jgi:hypothetical protein